MPIAKRHMPPVMRLVAVATLAACSTVGVSKRAEGVKSPNALAPCSALSPVQRMTLYEGVVDTTVFPPALGVRRIVVIPVDFSDAPAGTADAAAVVARATTEAVNWYREVSYGQLQIEVVSGRNWYRVSKPSTAYVDAIGKVTSPVNLAYEALKLASADLDLAGVTHVFVVAPPKSAVNKSNAFTQSKGRGLVVPGGEARFGAMLGSNTYANIRQGSYSAHHLAHEMMHTFGLPDLYDVSQADIVANAGAVGGWDPMSWVVSLRHPLAWHKRRLGWLSNDQLLCLDTRQGARSVDVTVTAIETREGVKAVGFVLDSSRVLLAEVRRRIGVDADIGSEGVIVYEIDVRRGTGTTPVHLYAALPDTSAQTARSVGPLFRAAFGAHAPQPARFEHPDGHVVVEVLGDDATGMRLRLTVR